MTCGVEWSQQKKLIELSPARPLIRAVPSHFPYLSAEMIFHSEEQQELDSGTASYWGMAHPIDQVDAQDGKMEDKFCLEVLAGALFEEDDSDYEDPLMPLRGRSNRARRSQSVPSRNGQATLAAFRKEWQLHDFTD